MILRLSLPDFFFIRSVFYQGAAALGPGRYVPLFFFQIIFAYVNKFMYLCRLKWFVLRNTLQDNI